jgi:DNA-binding MarR family transcriptional regulator
MERQTERDVTISSVEWELTAFSRRSRATAATRHPDLTLVEYSVLDFLGAHDDARAVDLATHFLLDKSTVSRQLAALRERGLIEPGPQLALSPAGTQALQEAHRRQSEALRERFDGWDTEDIARFANYLRRYNNG